MFNTCQNKASGINIDAKESGDSQLDYFIRGLVYVRSSRPKPQTRRGQELNIPGNKGNIQIEKKCG